MTFVNIQTKKEKPRSSFKSNLEKSNISSLSSTYSLETIENQQDHGEIERNAKFNFQTLLIQPKLKVSHPDDPYEKEADHVAEKIMRMSSSHENETQMQNSSENNIHRKCSSCEMKKKNMDEEKMKEIKKFLDKGFITQDEYEEKRRSILDLN